MGRMTMTVESTLTVDATLEEFWAYTDNVDAQVRYDERIESIRVTEGRYGEPGMVAEVTVKGPRGVDTADLILLAVDRPHSYVTATRADGVSTQSTVHIREVPAGVEVTTRIEVVTRDLNALERATLWLMRRSLRRNALAEHDRSMDAVAAYAAARRRGEL